MKSLKVILAFFILIPTFSISQNLVIEYDLLKDKPLFFSVDKSGKRSSINRPEVAKNGIIYVEVKNYNPFIWYAQTRFNSAQIADQTSGGMFSILNPILKAGVGGFLAQIPSSNNDPNAPGGGSFRGQGEKAAMETAKMAYKGMNQKYNSLAEVESSLKMIDYCLNKLTQLKYNPYLPSDSIKLYSEKMTEELLELNKPTTKDFVNKSNYIQQKFQEEYFSFKSSYSLYMKSAMETKEIETSSVEYVKSMDKKVEDFKAYFSNSHLDNKMMQLESTYQSIQNTPFDYTVSGHATGDIITVNLDFFKQAINLDPSINTTLSQADTSFKAKSKQFFVTVKGDLKMNTSIGIALPNYGRKAVRYELMDTTIVNRLDDNYIPNLAAYLNFNAFSSNLMQLGGSVGVGIPVSDKNRPLNLLMGLNTSFGTENRILIHAGLSVGQLKRLADGFQVGDKLSSPESTVPTVTSWKTGYFAGISFTLK